MRKAIKILLAVMISFCMLSDLMIPVSAAGGAGGGAVFPKAVDNLGIKLKKTSELVATDSGYMRVFYDESKIRIEYYDDDFNILSKKSIDMELGIWGGFYASADAYYIVEGQNNTDESNSAEVIRVIRYDKDWNRVGAAKITSNADLFGGEVRYPFDYGCVEMTEYDGTLYVATAHEGYVDPAYNQGHQGFLMLAVDIDSMKGKIVKSDLWHSFAQYIECSDSNLYVLEQSEGSRYTKLTRYDVSEDKFSDKSLAVLKYGGSRTSAWALACYASVDDMAVSSDNILCIGTSIDQSEYDKVSSDVAHNIYLTVTPKDRFTEEATTVKWLTDYSNDGKSFLGVNITKINDNRFLVAWEEYKATQSGSPNDTLSTSVLHYVFIDGTGNKISEEYTAAAPISDCHPIVKGSKVVYFASNPNMVNFYTIDAATGAMNKKTYRIAGEKATWDIADGVLTISGSGSMYVDTEAHHRLPVSSTARSFIYNSSENAWQSVRDSVTQIVIEEGITSIPEEQFVYFNSLIEVEIKEGFTSIGEKAFYSCKNLKKIIIPDSVTEIGADILWTGSTWIGSGGHVTKAAIYAHEGTYAERYAKDNGITFVSIPREEPDNTPTPGAGTISAAGIYCAQTNPSIVAGMVLDKSNVSDDIEYRWVACETSNPETWFEIKPWTTNDEWLDWTPNQFGDYVIVCNARIVGDPSSEVSAEFGTPYHRFVKGICQMPYEGEGGGYLIGFESYDNPNQSYQYEMLILDCTLLAQGLPAWVYTTGKCGVPENCLWTVWQPLYGYYWTLFRLYDRDGNLIDEVCYGFENI